MLKIARIFFLLVSFTSLAKVASVDVSLYNTLGAGVISKDLNPQKSFVSGFTFLPNLNFTPFENKEVSLKTSLEFNMEYEWVRKKEETFKDVISLGDLKLRSQIKNAYMNKDVGLFYTPGLKLEFPTSKSSIKQERLFGFGTNQNLTWTKWGVIVSLKPTLVAHVYYGEPKNILTSKNGVFLGYNYNNHTIISGLKVNFMLPRAKEETKLSSIGLVEYSYKFGPETLPMAFSLGVNSINSPYAIKEGFKWPFFGPNPLSSIYVNFDITL